MKLNEMPPPPRLLSFSFLWELLRMTVMARKVTTMEANRAVPKVMRTYGWVGGLHVF